MFRTLQEAQIFRILTNLFGLDNVIPRMSILTVCGGELPIVLGLRASEGLEDWARLNKCLYTIVDGQGLPRLVIDIFATFDGKTIDAVELEHQRIAPVLFSAIEIKYIVLSHEEVSEILDPCSTYDIVKCIQSKVDFLSVASTGPG